MEVYEDYLIETIVDRAFKSRRLTPQPAANPIDVEEMADLWTAKIALQNAELQKKQK
jgi:hypothetical protein